MGKLYKAGTTQEIENVVAEKNKENIVAINKVVTEKRVKKNGTN